MMHGHFKFLNSNDAQHLLRGSLRLSSLAYFRHLERRTGDDWIGDSTEGCASYTGTLKTSAEDNRQNERLRQLRITCINSSAAITDVTLICPHCLVFCFSTGGYSELRTTMCVSPAPALRYDAAIRIVHAQRLLSRIFYTGIVVSSGKPVSEVFHPPEIAEVTYVNRHAEITSDEMLAVSPFFKEPKYAAQSETRIVLRPRERDFPDRVDIQISEPERVVQLFELDMDVGKIRSQSGITLEGESLANALEALAVRMDEWWRCNGVVDSMPSLKGLPEMDDELKEAFYDEWKREFSEHAQAQVEAGLRCTEEFGREVSILYWDARLLNLNGIQWRSLDGRCSLGEQTSRSLRNLAASVRALWER